MNPPLTLIAVCLIGSLATLWGTPTFCQVQKPQMVIQAGHIRGINSVAFSPDGNTFASGGYDSTIKIWDTDTGLLLRTLTGHRSYINSIAFSPDGRTIASGSRDHTVKLWNIAAGKETRTLIGHTRWVNSVCFSPDGRTLASGSGDQTIKIWDTDTGKEIRTLTGHTNEVASVAFSPDGGAIASSSWDNTIKLWDIASGKETRTLIGHTGGVISVCFSPDGKTMASGSADHTVKIWDTASGRLLHTLTGHTDNVETVTFSPNGKTLASGSGDQTIKLWDTATGQKRSTLTGHTDGVTSVAFSPDSRTLASGSGEYTIKLWNTATGKEMHTLTGDTELVEVESVAFSPDGRTLASGTGDHTVNLWDTATGQMRHILTRHTDFVSSVCLSPDGKILAGGNYNNIIKNTITLLDAATGRRQRTLTGHTELVRTVCFSPDGKTLASASDDNTIKFWNMATGRLLRTLTGHASFINSVCFSPDGKTLASGSDDNTIKLWDTATGKALHTLTGHTYMVTSVCFSPDGRTLASGSWDDTINLWDTDTGRRRHILTGHTDHVESVCFSPDGRTLASGSGDQTIKIWDTVTGREIRALTGHTDQVNSVAFSPNGEAIASGSGDQTVKIWSTATGQELASLYALGKDDWAVVTPEGRFDASPGALTQMHYVVGLEPIDLAQIKDRYYEPGLLAKLLGFNKEPLRDVQAFDHVDLTPEVKAPDAVPADGKLPLTLTNRGGGIGRVQVFVNDKELIADARGPKPDPAAKTASLTVDVSHAPGLIPGKPNTVRIVTWNAEGYLSSRGTRAVYTPPGREELAPPDLWAIVGGISDYAGPSLHLTYPAKDAADFAHALTLAAKNLFGADKVHLTLLDTGGQPGALTPTKANLQQAFEAARKAKPGDIFVVYLAGHGVALTGEHDLYCYLTQDATTGSPTALSADTSLRLATTVSSEELTDWIKQVPAQKQVMVLDTCAAGAAAALLTAKRDIPSDQIRAIERLKDRTGFYVLMGCAADAVSYETSQYRQGLLTYSLLKGMKGASLRDGQYVDVSSLFNYAVDAVPTLAQNIGGVQRPFVAAPEAGSFDVGELSASDRQAIPLAAAGVLVLRPELVAEDEDLGLEALLAARLRDAGAASARGDTAAPALSFLDASDFPGALRPQGTYTVSGQAVAVKLRLRRDGKVVGTVQVSGTRADLPGLVAKLAAAVIGALGTP